MPFKLGVSSPSTFLLRSQNFARKLCLFMGKVPPTAFELQLMINDARVLDDVIKMMMIMMVFLFAMERVTLSMRDLDA